VVLRRGGISAKTAVANFGVCVPASDRLLINPRSEIENEDEHDNEHETPAKNWRNASFESSDRARYRSRPRSRPRYRSLTVG
jgi:hypothetical protein